MTFRDIKRNARRVIHDTLAEPVLYLATRTDAPMDGGITCRLHLAFETLGDLANTRSGFADREEAIPTIVFWNNQVLPRRDAIVITKDMGAWRLQVVKAPDDVTTDVEVTEVVEADVIKYGWTPGALWCGFPPPSNA